MSFKKLKITVYSLIGIVAAYYVFANSLNLSPLYVEGAFFWCLLISAYIAAWSFFKVGGTLGDVFAPDEHGRINMHVPQFMSFKTMPKLPKFLLVGCWTLLAVGILLSSVFLNWKAYRDQLGEPVIRSFSSDVQAVDISQIPIVDKALAYKLADKKLGERPSLGSQVKLGEPTIQLVNEKLIWAVPLEHSGIFKWFTNLSGTPGYVIVSASNVNDVSYVDNFKIKYQPNSYLLHDLKRYVRFTSSLFKGIVDYSFELDSTGQPYWIVTTYKNLKGFALPEADGVVLVNASTGETHRYGINEVPEWVDRVQPEEYIIQQIYNKGQYVHGFLNFSDRDKFMPSEGQNIIYNNGNCYLFTGLTSVGNDESAIGFMMVDMVSKEPILYQMNGATEYSAQASAQGKVQHLGYYASAPILLNIDGLPSFFMTLKDREGLIKQYAFVSVTNYSTVGVGETMGEAVKDYKTALRQDVNIGDYLGEKGEERELTGTVLRIASQYDGQQTVYTLILEESQDKIFAVTADKSGELAITQPGDQVKIIYHQLPGETPILISASSFDNLMFRQS